MNVDRLRTSQVRARAVSRRRRRAFSIVEVVTASAVLMLGISGALVTLQRSLSAIAHARQLDAVSGVLQSEIERLRTRGWSELQALQDSRDTAITAPTGGDFARFVCEREIRDVRPGMKEITVRASWGGLDGRSHVASIVTRYSQSGLNDYYYTTR